MKKFFGIILFMFLFSFSLHANAQGLYVSGNVGASILSDSDYNKYGFSIELDKGIALGVAAGYDFGKIRLEAEIGYQKNDVDKYKGFDETINMQGDISHSILFVNGYYDFHNNSKFTPFVTAGLGFARTKAEDWKIEDDTYPVTFTDNSNTEFIYNVGCGVAYSINEKVSIETKYRYLDIPDFDSYENHNLLLGVRYNF